MTAQQPTIVATSIGFRSRGRSDWDYDAGPVYPYMAELAHAGPAPRLCIVATAVGDHPSHLTAMYSAFGGAGFRTTHLALFPQPNLTDIRAHLLAQDIIWVAGGSVANLLALWRLHGLPPILHECWRAGVVLAGVSAGSVCWFEAGTTDSFGLPLHPVLDGLGFLPYSNSPHHDAEPQRRPLISDLVRTQQVPACYAADDGVALTFFDTAFHEAVTESRDAHAHYLHSAADGTVPPTARCRRSGFPPACCPTPSDRQPIHQHICPARARRRADAAQGRRPPRGVKGLGAAAASGGQGTAGQTRRRRGAPSLAVGGGPER